MKKFKGLKTPPIGENFAEIQKGYCSGCTKCIAKCEECIYDNSNLNRFVEFMQSTKKPLITKN